MIDPKYNYWLAEHDVKPVTAELKSRDHYIITVKKAVCIPLSRRFDFGLIPPSAWVDFPVCRRQLSWYSRSPMAGKTLLTTSLDLQDLGLEPETIISPSQAFQPPRRPNREEMAALIQRPSYLKSKPSQWDDLEGGGRRQLEEWMKLMRLKDITPEELLLAHSANHANFIEPVYFVDVADRPAPYSLGPTTRLCSACLEFFNILGQNHYLKYVSPCPGAVRFADLEPNKFYEVLTPGLAPK